jgi:hypothetical protein
MKNFLILAFALTLFGCKQNKTNETDLLAKVEDNYLSKNDIISYIPSNIQSSDSIALIQNLINSWIKKQLMLEKAYLNISEEDLEEVDKQVQDYKESLLIYKYEQMLIQQRLDTNVTKNEIINYYEEHATDFKLENSILRCTYIKVKKDLASINQLRKLYWSEKEEDIEELGEFCQLNADSFIFENKWITSEYLENILPISFPNHDNYLKYTKFIETQDSTHRYFVNIKTYKLKNESAPMEYIESHIRILLKNKKKLSLIKAVENNLYESALKNKSFEIYTK